MRIKSPNYVKKGFLMQQALQDIVKLHKTFAVHYDFSQIITLHVTVHGILMFFSFVVLITLCCRLISFKAVGNLKLSSAPLRKENAEATCELLNYRLNFEFSAAPYISADLA